MNSHSASSASRAEPVKPSPGSGGYGSDHVGAGSAHTMSEAPGMASEAVSAVSTQLKGLLDRQVGSGCHLASALAKSATRAADDLSREAPQLAGLVRGAAQRLDSLASDFQDQSVDDLVKSASDFTRRQPALVFGLAAVAGFMALRTVHSAAQAGETSRKAGRNG